MSFLEVRNINVYYGDFQALWDVSFEVNKGEMICLIGSNGAGKTTTLNTISGILHPRKGMIKFNDKRIDTLKSSKIVELGIAHIPEGRQIFPFMNVRDNLELGAFSKRARDKLKDSLEFVYQLFPRLKERETQFAGTLSGGEQQMLAIGRGLMSRPALLMLDEPSLGLMPRLVTQVFDVIERIHREGVTVLLVEQNVRFSLEVSDRGYVLETGKIVLKGFSDELLENEYVRKAYLGI